MARTNTIRYWCGGSNSIHVPVSHDSSLEVICSDEALMEQMVMVNGDGGATDSLVGSWLPRYKRHYGNSYQDKKEACFYSLAIAADGFQIRPHRFHCSTTWTRLYNSLFMVGYLPNWLIYLKHLAHRESNSNFAALIPALLVMVVQREGWSTGADKKGKVTRTFKG